MTRHATQHEEVRQHTNNTRAVETLIHADRQAFTRKFIDYLEHADLTAIICAVLYEIVGPDMVRTCSAQPNARSIVGP